MLRIIRLVIVAVRAAMIGVAAVLDRIARLFGGGGSQVPKPPTALPAEEVREEYEDAFEKLL